MQGENNHENQVNIYGIILKNDGEILQNNLYEQFPPHQQVASPTNQLCGFSSTREHDNGGLKFNLNLENNSPKPYSYSKLLKKVFISMDQIFSIDIEYQRTNKELCLRLMMLNLDDISLPVIRCGNHLHSDKAECENEKRSFIRSQNKVKYVRQLDTQNFERISLLIPLETHNSQQGEHNIVQESIGLKFVCQNSCNGRPKTAIMFTLETNDCQVLARKLLHVRVCSSPSRDKKKEEERCKVKRNSELAGLDVDATAPGKKVLKKTKEKTESVIISKKETTGLQTNKLINVKTEVNGCVKIDMRVPTSILSRLSQNCINIISNQILRTKEMSKVEKLQKDWNKLNDLLATKLNKNQ